jgi:signal transduction histidine kinase
MYCTEIIKTTWLIFSSETPALLYYSHIPTALIAVFLGIFVFLNNRKNISNKIFFALNISYGLLISSNLILWTNSYIPTIAFVWPITQILGVIMPILSLYFFYVFINKKDVGLAYKVVWSAIVISLMALASSRLNFNSFDNTICEPNLSNIISICQNGIYILIFIVLIYSFVKKIISKTLKKEEKKEIIYLFLGIFLFLISFLVIWQFADLYDSFNTEQYGLFGMTLLLAIVSFLIVRFKAFDIRLIGAQALVWALVIFVGSEFFFVTDLTAQLLVGVTLVISSILGLILIRSVKKEVALRESLEIANRNQESLIHFISHQLKGFFTKSKMIFSGLMEGDFGEVNATVKEMAQTGLKSDNNAVAMIQDILGASNLKTGTTNYNFKKVTLNDMVKKIGDSFTEEMKAKGLEYEMDIAEEPLVAGVDENQISQVFKNLIDNSLHYTPTGKISVILKKSAGDRKVLFEVSDTGVGLSEADKQRLFTEGGKGEESLKVNTNSTGYGLYIVKKIVESHSGRVWAESAGRGKGSKFYVELNLVE